MARSLRWLGIALGVILLAAAIFALCVASWTTRQLEAGPLQAGCLSPPDMRRAKAGTLDPRPILAWAALRRGYPGDRWPPEPWPLHYAAVTYLGFVFIPEDAQRRMLAQVPACPPRSVR